MRRSSGEKVGTDPGRKFDVTKSLAQIVKVERERKIRRRNAAVKIHLHRHFAIVADKARFPRSLDLQSVSAQLEDGLGRREITLVNPKIQIGEFPEDEQVFDKPGRPKAGL